RDVGKKVEVERVLGAFAKEKGIEAPKQIESCFTGLVPLVRVELPKDKDPENNWKKPIETKFAEVIPEDRLLYTLTSVQDKVNHAFRENKWGKAPPLSKAELITPPRAYFRFAAVALYLGYTAEKKGGPALYILEAGMATGHPKVIYVSQDINAEIVRG